MDRFRWYAKIVRRGCVMVAVAIAAGCSEHSAILEPQDTTPAPSVGPYAAAIERLGFDASMAVDAGDYVRVQDDILLLKRDLASGEDSGSQTRDPRIAFQWRTDTIVSTTNVQGIKVDLSGINSQPAWVTAARAAMIEWNSINGSRVRFIEGTPADISFSFYSTAPYIFADAAFPTGSPGGPGGSVRINTAFSGNTSAAAKVFVLVHELGHTIGFRHTNWQGLGETQGPVGANLIAGTPQTDANSVMNGGTAGYQWAGFSGYDVTAARNLYPGITVAIKKPSNVGLAITQAGTYTWTSTVSGGSGYTYQWARDYYLTGQYTLLGTSATQPLAITCFDNQYGIALRLTVTASNGATETVYSDLPAVSIWDC